MSSNTGRKAIVTLKKQGGKKDLNMSDYLESFTFTDVAAGSSDSISLGLENISKKFLDSWLPKKGNVYIPKITLCNWEKDGKNQVISCGKFTLDDFSVSGRPLSATLNAVSAPANSAFTTKQRTKTWKSITVQQIAKVIAARYKLKLVYDASKISISSLEQNSTADSSFLNGICEDYALAMKIFADKLVIYSKARYESKKAVRVVKESDMLSWSYNTTLTGTYTGCKYSYTNPSDNKTVTVNVGKGSRWLTANGEASSKADAQKRAYAAVNNSNEGMTELSFTIPADPKIIATANIKVTGLGKLNGKYFIEQVSLSIGGNGGSVMSVKAHKVQQRLPKS